jgi:hypothetical protein
VRIRNVAWGSGVLAVILVGCLTYFLLPGYNPSAHDRVSEECALRYGPQNVPRTSSWRAGFPSGWQCHLANGRDVYLGWNAPPGEGS